MASPNVSPALGTRGDAISVDGTPIAFGWLVESQASDWHRILITGKRLAPNSNHRQATGTKFFGKRETGTVPQGSSFARADACGTRLALLTFVSLHDMRNISNRD